MDKYFVANSGCDEHMSVAKSAAITITLSYYLTNTCQRSIIVDLLKREFLYRSQKLHYLILHIKYISFAKKCFTYLYIDII